MLKNKLKIYKLKSRCEQVKKILVLDFFRKVNTPPEFEI